MTSGTSPAVRRRTPPSLGSARLGYRLAPQRDDSGALALVVAAFVGGIQGRASAAPSLCPLSDGSLWRTPCTTDEDRAEEDMAALEGLVSAVRERRPEKGLNQDQVAKRAGLDFTTVYMVERSAIELTWANMRRLAVGLDVGLGALFQLAEELAPREGGVRWRRWTGAAESDRDIG